MKNIPSIVDSDSATVIYDGKPYTLKSGQPNFQNFKSALLDGDINKAMSFLEIPRTIENWGDGSLKVSHGVVTYNGYQLHGVVVDKLLELLEAGMSKSSPFIKFVKNLLENPSKNSVDELYGFLSYKSLPIDDDGYVVGYKGVTHDFWSCHGNTHTTVIQGRTNERGQIWNGVGEVIEVLRRDVDDNPKNHCSDGLHIGSFDYAKDWARSAGAQGGDGKLLLVRFNPKDAVSVPNDGCQKLRVCKYEVVSEVELHDDSEIEEPHVSYSTSGKVSEERSQPRDEKGRFTSHSLSTGI
jgi:hypothetical protein